MKATQWNVTMVAAVALLVLSVPFLAYADFADGGFSGFTDGGFSGFGDGGFTGFSDGGIDQFANGGFTGSSSGGIGGSSDTDFDDFDDNFQPIDGIPGNGPGADVIVPGPGDDFPPGCTVNCIPQPSPRPGTHTADRDSLHIFINQIILHDAFGQLPGNQVPLLVTFENDGTKTLENTKVIVNIPDLAVRAAVGPFDLKVGNQLSKILVLELPEWVQPGEYSVRFQVYNENRERIVHRDIEVVDSE